MRHTHAGQPEVHAQATKWKSTSRSLPDQHQMNRRQPKAACLTFSETPGTMIYLSCHRTFMLFGGIVWIASACFLGVFLLVLIATLRQARVFLAKGSVEIEMPQSLNSVEKLFDIQPTPDSYLGTQVKS